MTGRVPVGRDFGGALVNRIGRRYAAGADAADAAGVAADLRSSGLLVTCDYVAHPARTSAEADAALDRLLDLVAQLGSTGLAHEAAVDVLVALRSLGEGSSAQHRVDRLSEAAAAAGTWLGIRPYDHADVDAALETAHRLRATFPDTGVELWASLRRTAGDVTTLLAATDGEPAGAGPRVILRPSGDGVRVPAPVGLPGATDIDRAFIRYSKRLIRGVARPVLAAGDPTLVLIVETLADGGDPTTGPREDGAAVPSRWLELMMDMGQRGDEATRLAALGRRVRVKVPFGPRWRAVGLRGLAAGPPRLRGFTR